jgi:hypothetical protein
VLVLTELQAFFLPENSIIVAETPLFKLNGLRQLSRNKKPTSSKCDQLADLTFSTRGEFLKSIPAHKGV